MKTGRDAIRLGSYISECCLQELHFVEGQMLPRCPRCNALTIWELGEFNTGDENEKQLVRAGLTSVYASLDERA
jgi:hypothetical protein